MAHFAEINAENLVTRVLVTSNEMPADGYYWLRERFGGTWLQTSYNTWAGQHKLGGTPLRKNFAGVGFTYDADRDAFIPPKPFDSWVLDEDTCQWSAPVPYPTDGAEYYWDEETTSWAEAVDE